VEIELRYYKKRGSLGTKTVRIPFRLNAYTVTRCYAFVKSLDKGGILRKTPYTHTTKKKAHSFKQRKSTMKHTIYSSTKHNTPELRFGEFEGVWEEKRLGEVVDFYRGNNIKSLWKKDEKNIEKAVFFLDLARKKG